MLLFSFVSFSQSPPEDIQPQEVHAIGKLHIHMEDGQQVATVFDKRVDEMYNFKLVNNECGQLVDGKEYEFRLLGTCLDSDCTGVGYQLVEALITMEQLRRDTRDLREGTVETFN